jgi:hypothetical protein
VIVIDDGLPDSYLPPPPEFGSGQVTILPGIQPFVFSRNCNLGIRAAGTNDVILLNDDAVLKTVWGFTALSKAARSGYGIVAAVTNRTGNLPQKKGLAESGVREVVMVAFICVYLQREMVDKIGLLDEDYTDYGREDDDYCYRARKAGYRVGVCDGCFVDHAFLPSAFREPDRRPISFEHNDAVFFRKHGISPVVVAEMGLHPPEAEWMSADNLKRLESLIQEHKIQSVLGEGICAAVSSWLAQRVKQLMTTDATHADLVFINGERSLSEVENAIIACLPKAQRVICGDEYQRNSIREMLYQKLPGHKACGSFWWKVIV